MNELIWKQDAIDAICEDGTWLERQGCMEITMVERKYRDVDIIENLPTIQPERLTDDDFETIRIHLNAYKEKLCNQQRWKEAEEYQRIIDRFMAFASVQPKHGKWEYHSNPNIGVNLESAYCSCCGLYVDTTGNIDFDEYNFCPRCGAKMEG